MKYLFLSDLHIGNGSKADDFGKNDHKLMKWLLKTKVMNDIDDVIFIGDVYERWQFGMKHIEKAHPLFCAYLKNSRILKGNHDYQLLRRKTINIPLDRGGYAHISHGCWNDKDMSNPLVRFGVWLYGATMERILPNFENRWAEKKPKGKIYTMTKKYADTWLEKKDCKIVVCGHTHKTEIIRSKAGIYANTGTCQGGKFSGIILDTVQGIVELVKS